MLLELVHDADEVVAYRRVPIKAALCMIVVIPMDHFSTAGNLFCSKELLTVGVKKI